jgi:protocatechuate 3,4-dioxygenase beta subunit
VPLTIKLTIQTSSCAPFPGAAVYLWHCNATGGYSLYSSSGYGSSAANLSRVSLSTDMVFRDGYASQLAAVTGNTTSGYTATLTVPA